MKSITFKVMILTLIFHIGPVYSTPQIIKLATIAPKNSIWHQHLVRMGEQWTQASDGQVTLRIYAGTLGDEADILRRVRIGQIDAALISSAALSSVDEAMAAFNIPLAFRSTEELDYVRRAIKPKLETALNKRGYKALFWGDAGWVYFFTRDPVATPDDLKRSRLFMWSTGDSAQVEKLWKKFQIQPIPLASVDILPALQTGMISAYQAPPLAALANQWFPFTPWMTDMRWAPLTGATIVRNSVWEMIPANLHPALKAIAKRTGAELLKDVRALEQSAIQAMQKHGLQIQDVSPETRAEWELLVSSAYPDIRGSIVAAPYFDETLRLIEQYRNESKTTSSSTQSGE